MENSRIKMDLLALIATLRTEQQALLDDLSPQEKVQSGSLERWSARDMLVHLVFWGGHFNRQLQASLSDQKIPQAGDYYNLINDGLFVRHQETSYETALEEEESIYQKGFRLLSTLDADSLCNPTRFNWLEGRSLLDRALNTFVWHVLAHICDFHRVRGQMEKAIYLQETYSVALATFPGWDANAPYNLGCFYAQNNLPEHAIRSLSMAFSARPDLLEWARQDSDLDPLRDLPDFIELLNKTA